MSAPEPPASAAAVLDEVNAQHGTAWILGERLSGGYQSGAYLITDRSAGQAVLKWSADRDWASTVLAAAPTVDLARASGWPTPAWSAVGRTADGCPYQVQDFVEGHAREVITHDWLDVVLPVVAGQAGLGGDGMRNWSDYDREVVFGSPNGNRAAVAASGPAGRRVHEAVADLNRGFEHVCLSSADLVHGDLNPGNVLLADNGHVTVIDVEAVGRGTRLHDLTTLLVYAVLWGDSGVRERLLLECERVGPPGWTKISLSAVAIDLLAFGVRHWPASDLAVICDRTTELLRSLQVRQTGGEPSSR